MYKWPTCIRHYPSFILQLEWWRNLKFACVWCVCLTQLELAHCGWITWTQLMKECPIPLLQIKHAMCKRKRKRPQITHAQASMWVVAGSIYCWYFPPPTDIIRFWCGCIIKRKNPDHFRTFRKAIHHQFIKRGLWDSVSVTTRQQVMSRMLGCLPNKQEVNHRRWEDETKRDPRPTAQSC